MTDWYIVGRGPSLLTVTADEFGPGPVIALNRGIEQVRALGLPNPLYAMAKDGCGGVRGASEPPGHACTLRVPVTVTLLLSRAESEHCLAEHPDRIVIDVEGLGLPWYYQSAPVAARWAVSHGATRLLMFAHDAHVNGDTRRVEGGELVGDDQGYFEAGRRTDQLAREFGVAIVWRPA